MFFQKTLSFLFEFLQFIVNAGIIAVFALSVGFIVGIVLIIPLAVGSIIMSEVMGISGNLWGSFGESLGSLSY